MHADCLTQSITIDLDTVTKTLLHFNGEILVNCNASNSMKQCIRLLKNQIHVEGVEFLLMESGLELLPDIRYYVLLSTFLFYKFHSSFTLLTITLKSIEGLLYLLQESVF